MGKDSGQTRGPRANNASPEGGSTTTAAGRDGDAAATGGKKDYRNKEPKEYRATARGYVDGVVREPGDIFATREPQGSWMESLKGKGQTARERAVDDTMASRSDDPDLSTFSIEALQAEALRFGLTNAKGLSKDDLIAAIRAAHDEDRAR